MSGGSHKGHRQDCPGKSLQVGVTWCPEDPRTILGFPVSWCDLASGRSHEGHPRTVLTYPGKLSSISRGSQQGHLRTVLGHPCMLKWLDTWRILREMSEDSPGTYLWDEVTWISWRTSQDCPGTSLQASPVGIISKKNFFKPNCTSSWTKTVTWMHVDKSTIATHIAWKSG